ncbi:MAG: wax ester/triacylglycerol synthase family O-acyltransferase [Acidimicrobiales bacterium]
MDRLSSSDAWFLDVESTTVPMHVTGLLLLDPSTAGSDWSPERLRRNVGAKLAAIASLRRVLVEVPLGIDHPTWRPVVPDIDEHVRHRTAPGHRTGRPGAVMSEFATTPLPRDRPLWEALVIDGLDDDRVAFAIKVHHAIADGVTGLELLTEILDLSPEPTPAPDPGIPTDVAAPPAAANTLAAALAHRAVTPLRPVRAAAGLATAAGRLAARTARGGTDRAAHPLGAPRTPFNGTLTERRTVAFGQLPLADFKHVARAADVTVNDVVLAAVTFTLRRSLQRSRRLPDRALICSVPVSTHGDTGSKSANQVSDLFVPLPVHLDEPLERLRVVHDGCIEAKALHSALGASVIGDLVELLPAASLRLGARIYSQAGLADRFAPIHNVIVSNVAGPPVPLYLEGAEVEGLYPFGPLVEGTGVNITVFSNAGRMNVGVITCPDLLPRPGTIVADLRRGMDQLLAAVKPADPH